MEVIGDFVLIVAFVISLFVVAVSIIGIRKKRADFLHSAENGVTATFWLLNIAVFSLFYLLFKSDFHIEYVANYTNRTLPLMYKFAAFWGGQDGSLLLWSWLLTVFAYIIVIQYRKKDLIILPYVILIMMAVASFFIFLNLFLSNPFDVLARVSSDGTVKTYIPSDGNGLNPLLQHPIMIIHPPLTFLGYVGFTVPFAFAMSALFTRKLGDGWIKYTRRWTIFSWFFLGVGIILGAKWAYVELGWGGYWSWDPVENASLMPWLTGTAFLHSVIIQEKKGMLKTWNITLIILTFILCIFGTFITRSGIISSVHAFAESSIGWFFLGFIGIVFLFSLIIIFKRFDFLKSSRSLDSILSRESGFLFNNIVFFGASAAIFWGTMFPYFSEAFSGNKITLGPPFYNKVFFPIGIFLLLLTGIAPLLAFRKTSLKSLKKNIFLPTLLSIILCFILALLGVKNIHALIYFTIGLFVFFVIILEFYRGILSRIKRNKENFFKALINLISYNKRRYGGYIVHLGIFMIFIGITGSFFNIAVKKEISEGDTINIKDYQIKYETLLKNNLRNYISESVLLEVSRGGKFLKPFTPERRLYKASNQITSEVRIYSTLKEDLYMIYAGKTFDSDKVVVQILLNPLVKWIWIGAWTLSFGALIIFMPNNKKGYELNNYK